jgi:Uma2 family endonuclease
MDTQGLDPNWLEERRRHGLDRFDEVWDGVLHVVPFPTTDHQRFEGSLGRVLYPIAVRSGLEILYRTAIYDSIDSDENYRGPDISVVDSKHVAKRGIEARAELVVEVLSPRDESRKKLPFYAKCGILEVWLVDPITRVIEVFVLREAKYVAAETRGGLVVAPRLGLELCTIDGPKLRISWAGGTAEI